MIWQSWGFKGDPLSVDPVTHDTLTLYTGHKVEVDACLKLLANPKVRLVIEGSRGVGTTSFANFLRFSLQEKKIYFTSRNEIRVDAGWKLETLLAVIIANIVREIDLFGLEDIKKDPRFQNAKALSLRIAETYRSFGIDAFGFGVNYGKEAGVVTQPIIVPSAVLGHHLEDLANLIVSSGFKNGILLQLNNLDVGEIHDGSHLKYLFNALRDYAQTNYVSWMLVGDVGLRKFIAQHVDRFDDIISFEVKIDPLSNEEFIELIEKRICFYQTSPQIKLPIDIEVFLYLFKITKGRLRYIFGLLSRLISMLHIGDLTDRITLEIAKPTLMKLARSRIERHDLTPGEEAVLKELVKMQEINSTKLAETLGKSPQYVSNILNKLINMKLIAVRRHGKNKFYSPSLDASIAYSQQD